MPRCWQASMARPAVAAGIVGFHLMESTSCRLSANDEDASLQHGCCDSAACRGNGRKPSPTVGLRIVDLVNIEIARVVAVHTPADGIKVSLDGGDGKVVARGRDRSQCGPSVC